jgi:hypothetical protein
MELDNYGRLYDSQQSLFEGILGQLYLSLR